MTSLLAKSIELRCGTVLANRIVKPAMSEGMADAQNRATPRLESLYRRWSTSGAGVLFSGNIAVDRYHLERPLNVVLEDESALDALRRMAAAGKAGGSAFWAQLSHTGRQVVSAINQAPLAPSVVEIDVMRGMGYEFSPPHAMDEAQIAHAIAQFATSAGLAQQAGFDGVELHGAHGYLISQFLSARTNLRTDSWGGPLANRARFLIAVIAAVREAVGPKFPIGLKLNAADFLKGGFTHEECVEVAAMLNDTSLDLLELSGGSLEQPKMMGLTLLGEGQDKRPDTTRQREAYFVEFAGDVRRVAKMAVMVTGGFRTRAGMEAALEAGHLDLIGIGRPMIIDPDLPRKLIAGEIDATPRPEEMVEMFHVMPWLNMQLERMGDGLEPDPQMDGSEATERFMALETGNFQALLAARAAIVA